MLGVDPQHQLENVLGIMIRLCPFCLCTFHGLHPATPPCVRAPCVRAGFFWCSSYVGRPSHAGRLGLAGPGTHHRPRLGQWRRRDALRRSAEVRTALSPCAWEKASPNRPNQEEFIFRHPDTPSSFKMKEQLLSDTAWHGTSLRSFIYT